MRQRLALLGLLLLAGCNASFSSNGYHTRKAVILVLDGPRQSEMWAEPNRALIPQMDQVLRPMGALMSGFRNNGPTYTTSGHTALCSSHYEDLENSAGSQLPSRPSLFQVYRRATGAPASKAWVIASKDKLAILADSRDPAWNGRDRASTWTGVGGAGLGSGYGEDVDTRAAVYSILDRDEPDLVLINLKQPDAAGHANDWGAYQQGIRDGDAFAAELWAWLQAHAAFRDQTAFFVTHDHGRHLDNVADGFVSHGDACEGCRQIALLALGPDFKRGVSFPQGGEQIDLAPTIARLMGFSLPQADGRILNELFQEQP